MVMPHGQRYKIVFASNSLTGPQHRDNFDSFGKFPLEHTRLDTPKGQLFIIADAKHGNPGGRDPGKMAVRIIQEQYFAYPSTDIAFCLQRAFDVANRQIYQYAKANGLLRKIGATCTAVVIADRMAYIAHVGDCRVYRVSLPKIEQLTQDHVRVIETMPRENGHPRAGGGRAYRPVLTRALGVQLGVKVDILSRIPLHRDEYLVLCTDGMKNISPSEIQHIVLSSSPERAARRLTQLALERGSTDNVTTQIVKIYQGYSQGYREGADRQKQGAPASEINTYALKGELSQSSSTWPVYFLLMIFVTLFGLLLSQKILHDFPALLHHPTARPEIQPETIAESLSPEQREAQLLARAQEYLQQKQYKNALRIFRTILRNNGGHHPQAQAGILAVAEAFKADGARAARRGEWRLAAKFYKKAISLNPADPELQPLLAEARRKAAQKQRNRVDMLQPTAYQSGTLSLRGWQAEQRLTLSQSIRTPGLQPEHWALPGLILNEDYRIRSDGLLFYETLPIKKAFYRRALGNIEVEVEGTVLLGQEFGNYGIIFGHALDEEPYRNFYLFSVDGSHYALQEVSPRHVKYLVSGRLHQNRKQSSGPIVLKVKVLDKLVLLYANGQLLKMLTLERPLHSGIGLYADPKMRVEFSRLRIHPVNPR
ncbi:MAG: hypothetical protein D6681_15805 [Calditrichaeota bacterium]|nr:MAG: hypothetical protein D6681_15805 [Calditrichota bacterium]